MFSLWKSREVILRSSLSVSAVLLGAICLAGPFGDLRKRLDGAQSPSDLIRIVRSVPAVAGQDEVQGALRVHDAQQADSAETAAKLKAIVDLHSMAESGSAPPADADQEAKAIKNSPFYQDPGIDRKRNWLAQGLERLKNIHLPRFKVPRLRPGSASKSDLGAFPKYIVWGLLLAGVVTLLVLAARHIQWQRTLTRKAKALLEEDEPDRSLDEWLQLADTHAAAGRYREAVRALYLACLLRFDENDVARFDRSQTNWEHLVRIEASPRRPAAIDFRPPTLKFDRIWYGYEVDGMNDVELFRTWYREFTDILRRVPA